MLGLAMDYVQLSNYSHSLYSFSYFIIFPVNLITNVQNIIIQPSSIRVFVECGLIVSLLKSPTFLVI